MSMCEVSIMWSNYFALTQFEAEQSCSWARWINGIKITSLSGHTLDGIETRGVVSQHQHEWNTGAKKTFKHDVQCIAIHGRTSKQACQPANSMFWYIYIYNHNTLPAAYSAYAEAESISYVCSVWPVVVVLPIADNHHLYTWPSQADSGTALFPCSVFCSSVFFSFYFFFALNHSYLIMDILQLSFSLAIYLQFILLESFPSLSLSLSLWCAL